MHANIPDSAASAYSRMMDSADEADALYMAGKDDTPLVSTRCSCGRPLAPIPGARTCIGDVVGKELARVRREQKRIDGFVPWYSTPQFKETLALLRSE